MFRAIDVNHTSNWRSQMSPTRWKNERRTVPFFRRHESQALTTFRFFIVLVAFALTSPKFSSAEDITQVVYRCNWVMEDSLRSSNCEHPPFPFLA